MYTYMYVHMHMYTYACMNVCIHVCMYVCMYVCVYACMYTCINVCIYIYTRIYVHKQYGYHQRERFGTHQPTAQPTEPQLHFAFSCARKGPEAAHWCHICRLSMSRLMLSPLLGTLQAAGIDHTHAHIHTRYCRRMHRQTRGQILKRESTW